MKKDKFMVKNKLKMGVILLKDSTFSDYTFINSFSLFKISFQDSNHFIILKLNRLLQNIFFWKYYRIRITGSSYQW